MDESIRSVDEQKLAGIVLRNYTEYARAFEGWEVYKDVYEDFDELIAQVKKGTLKDSFIKISRENHSEHSRKFIQLIRKADVLVSSVSMYDTFFPNGRAIDHIRDDVQALPRLSEKIEASLLKDISWNYDLIKIIEGFRAKPDQKS
jgi:hypothetical protein